MTHASSSRDAQGAVSLPSNTSRRHSREPPEPPAVTALLWRLFSFAAAGGSYSGRGAR